MMRVSRPAAPAPRVGDQLELAVGEAVHGGWCIARQDNAPVHAEAVRADAIRADAGQGGADGDRSGPEEPGGRVVFVRHALPGERVLAVVTQVTARFARADAVQVLRPAADRVQPPCPHARPGGCGGCDWQHASLPAQRALKAAVIRQQLARIAGLDVPVTVEAVPGDMAGLGWRTRVTYAVGADGAAGLRKHRSHEIVEIGECPIAHPLVNAAGITGRRWPGSVAVQVTAVPATGERAVVSSESGRSRRSAPPVTADAVQSVARSGARSSLRGRGYLTQRAAGRDWQVGLSGFWQVHPGAADLLAAAVLGFLRPQPGDTALDLYCGAGLFAGVLAEAVGPGGAVLAVESDATAARYARRNLRQAPWVRVHQGDVAEVLGRTGLAGASIAVLDPPRQGASRAVIRAICDGPAGRSSLRRLGYVSCDPATLARDLALLLSRGWRLEELRGFDAFPMTHHVECLAALVRD